jgi:hypothetical protein
MQFEAKKVDTTQDAGNSIVVTMEIKLTEEDATDYIRLDELLREHGHKQEVQDLVSDYGFSYSNDILASIYWDRLSDLLAAVIVELRLY